MPRNDIPENLDEAKLKEINEKSRAREKVMFHVLEGMIKELEPLSYRERRRILRTLDALFLLTEPIDKP